MCTLLMKKPLPLIFQVLGALLGIYAIYRGITVLSVISNSSMQFSEGMRINTYYIIAGILLIASPYISRGIAHFNKPQDTVIQTKARLWWAIYILVSSAIALNFIGAFGVQENVVYHLSLLLQALIALIILLVIGAIILATHKVKFAEITKLTFPIRGDDLSRQIFTGVIAIITILVGLQVFLPRVMETVDYLKKSSSTSTSTPSFLLK